MCKINNFINNDNIVVKDCMGAFSITEYKHDLSVSPGYAPVGHHAVDDW